MSELKPCPFCGSKETGCGYNGQPALSIFVYCRDCQARGPEIEPYSASGNIVGPEWNDVATKWNERESCQK